MSDQMSEHVYLLTLFLPLATVLIIFGMKYLSAVRQAQARILAEDAYRELAQNAVAAQAANAAALSGLQAELSQIQLRLASVEKILKAVE